ncbi:Transcription termination factor MTERF5, chloroplastic [Vitis vinifera]|uniref:Transcription termination factor MTERF5, chloroplastic n=1 Tax=Vitis vinifera TaxID=29760 RepID=A0A438BT67_VITVI|nr:Transcription termination factor MTERF5, chloroplastic [Vitis vinifera]
MRAYSGIRSSELPSLSRGPFSIPRNRAYFPGKVSFCQAKFAESGVDGSSISLRVVPPSLLAAEKEEAKAVLSLFLKKQGLSNAVAARTINKSELFIDHLVSRLHSVHKSRYLVGAWRYFGGCCRKLPKSPDKEIPVAPVSSSSLSSSSSSSSLSSSSSSSSSNPKLDSKKIKAMARIKAMTRRHSHDPLQKAQLCGVSLSENIIPTMAFLENLGVDKKQWAKVIHRFPGFLTYSRQKVKATVDFLEEMGLSAESIGKVLTRCPNIISYSVEDKLRPTAEYSVH